MKFYMVPEGVLCLAAGSKWHGWLFHKTDGGRFQPLRKLDDEFIQRAFRAAAFNALVEIELVTDKEAQSQ